MRRAELSRTEFLEWIGDLSRGGNVPEKAPRLQGRHKTVSLVWLDDDPEEKPIVAVAASDMREFLAFTSTYVGTHFPFTAFFRVVSSEMIDLLPRGIRPKRPEVMQALIGATIADAALQIGSSALRAGDIPVQAGLATPSALVLASYLMGYDNDLAIVALERWHLVKLELGGGESKVPLHRFKTFWETVLSALAPEAGLSRSVDQAAAILVRSVRDDQEGSTVLSPAALGALPELEVLGQSLRGSREERVRALDQVSAYLGRTSSSLERRELILGYVAAQVAEGSMNYLALARRFTDENPLAIVWFGIFSGLSRNSDVLTAGECLGRRLLRNLARSGSGLPPLKADLSYEELLLLSQEGRVPKLRTDHQSVIEVELIPGVCGRFRVSRLARREEDPNRSQIALEQARRLVSQLQAILRDTEAPQQLKIGSLFVSNDADEKNPIRPRPPTRRKNTK